MIGFSQGAPIITNPETAVTLARVVLASLGVVTVLWYRMWCEVSETCPSYLKRRICSLIGRME